MTEAEWLTSDDTQAMYAYACRTGAFSRRAATLFGVACVRALPEPDYWGSRLRPARGGLAAGCRPVHEVVEAEAEAEVGTVRYAAPDPQSRVFGVPNGPPLDTWSDAVARALGAVARRTGERELRRAAVVAEQRGWDVRRACADLLRDVFGNPFRPVAFDPGWRTDTAVSLAKGMYDGRDFGAIPILADALQDAGCEDEQVLTHCRGPGPHVRGCWVVDLVLGKS